MKRSNQSQLDEKFVREVGGVLGTPSVPLYQALMGLFRRSKTLVRDFPLEFSELTWAVREVEKQMGREARANPTAKKAKTGEIKRREKKEVTDPLRKLKIKNLEKRIEKSRPRKKDGSV